MGEHLAQWGHLYPGWTLERALLELLPGANGPLPLTLLAQLDHQDLGSVSLLAHDHSLWPHLTPWVASLYVRPAWRGCGLGHRLLQAIQLEAYRLGFGRVYLFTERPTQRDWYQRLGWQYLETRQWQHQPLFLLTRRLPWPQ